MYDRRDLSDLVYFGFLFIHTKFDIFLIFRIYILRLLFFFHIGITLFLNCVEAGGRLRTHLFRSLFTPSH